MGTAREWEQWERGHACRSVRNAIAMQRQQKPKRRHRCCLPQQCATFIGRKFDCLLCPLPPLLHLLFRFFPVFLLPLQHGFCAISRLFADRRPTDRKQKVEERGERERKLVEGARCENRFMFLSWSDLEGRAANRNVDMRRGGR